MFQPKKCWWSNTVVLRLWLWCCCHWRHVSQPVTLEKSVETSSIFWILVGLITIWAEYSMDTLNIDEKKFTGHPGFYSQYEVFLFQCSQPNLSREGRFWCFFDLKPPQTARFVYWATAGPYLGWYILVSRHHGCWHQAWVKPDFCAGVPQVIQPQPAVRQGCGTRKQPKLQRQK